MKTLQQYLRELNKNILVNKYFYKIREEFLRETNKNITLADLEKLRKKYTDFIEKYIDRLANLTVKPHLDNGETGVLYCYNYIHIEDGEKITEPFFEFTTIEELQANGNEAENYSYTLTPQDEIVGFLVAENSLTQKNIYDMIVYVIYEASFYGYEDEDKAEVLESLEQIREESSFLPDKNFAEQPRQENDPNNKIELKLIADALNKK